MNHIINLVHETRMKLKCVKSAYNFFAEGEARGRMHIVTMCFKIIAHYNIFTEK